MAQTPTGQQSPESEGIAPDIRVAFLPVPGFTLLPFAGFVETLRHSADESDRSRQIYCRWSCLGATREPISASCGVAITPWETYGEPERFDYVVVVGGLLSFFDSYPRALFDFIIETAEAGLPLVGLCTGSFVLAEAGIMDGVRCAVHFRHREELVRRFPTVIPVTDEMYVMDRGRITCPGGTAAIDLAVELIMHHCGRARALKGLPHMVVDRHRASHHLVRQPFESLLNCGDWRVEAAVELMQQNLGEPYSIRTLAARIGCSVRQLDRSFVGFAGAAPAVVWREMRLRHARWRLVNSSRTITQIAYECGFADSAHFTRWFRRSFGETPHAFRRRRLAASISAFREVAAPR